MSDVTWRSAQDTNVGIVRTVNEDSIVSLSDIQVWAVADGMGGYEAGDVASNMIIEALDAMTDKESLNEVVDSIEDSLIDVNRRILEYADNMLDGRTLGSTVVTLLIKGSVGVCLWAGDSRLYRYRNNELIQLSRDHSYVEELVQQGALTPEEAVNHPNSNVITRAIGANTELCIDINIFNVQMEDTFLLCSDGLYNMVSKEEITKSISNYSFKEAVDNLIQKALNNGANDNVSVILVNAAPETSHSTQVNL